MVTKIEIAADHALLVQKDFDKAIEKYSLLADRNDPRNAAYALRANWILAGILLGERELARAEAQVGEGRLQVAGDRVVDQGLHAGCAARDDASVGRATPGSPSSAAA